MHYSNVRFAASLVYIGVVAAGAAEGGLAGWASILLGGTLYPLIDAVPWGRVTGPQSDDQPHAEWPTLLLTLFAISQTFVILWVLYLTTVRDYAIWEWLGIALSLGTLTGGIGIPAAHELIHRSDRRARAIGVYLLSLVNYMHFRIEHIYGHHLKVATPSDPATARRGEGLWTFIPRSVWGQFISAFQIEEKLRRTAQGRPKRVNRMIWYFGIQSAVLAVIGLQFGGLGILVMLVQSAMAIIFLEATNYIEHYGLLRKQVGQTFEPISIHHSWNTDSLLTNSLAFNLGLHADHHANPRRPFPQLRHLAEAPQLPAGYLTMLSIAAIPMLWRKIMDNRLDDCAANVSVPIP